MKILRCIPALMLACCAQATAADLVWTNESGGNWFTAANWNPNQVPGPGDQAFITNNGTYTVTVNGGATVAGLHVGGGSGIPTVEAVFDYLTLDGPSFIQSNAVLRIALFQGSGDLTVSGQLRWTHGTMRGTGRTSVASGGSLFLETDTQKNLERALINNGTALWTGGILAMNSGQLTNNSTLTFSNSVLTAVSSSSSGSVFYNAGQFIKQGPERLFFYNNIPFHNAGTVEVQSGRLELNGSGTHTGPFAVAAGAILGLAGNTTLSAAATIGGGGNLETYGAESAISITGAVSVASAALIGEGPYAPPVTFNGPFTCNSNLTIAGADVRFNGPFNLAPGIPVNLLGGVLNGSVDVTMNGLSTWSGGRMTGTGRTIVASGATLLMNSGNQKELERVLINNGTTIFTDGVLYLNNGWLTNNGTFACSNSVLTSLGTTIGAGSSLFRNNGLFIKQGNQELLVANFVPFYNTGMVEARGGLLNCQGTNYVQSAGQTLLIGGDIAGSPIRIQGGTLAGTSTVQGSVNNSGGIVSPGLSLGRLTITGNYTQAVNGRLNIELAGSFPGGNFDVLQVAGTASLAGALNVTVAPDFSAPNGPLHFLNSSSRIGTFSPSTIGTPPSPMQLALSHGATGAVLTVSHSFNAPPPTCTPASGVIAWWRAENDAVDFVTGQAATLVNGATFAAGKVGTAFSFDGVDDHISVPDSEALHFANGVTLECWFQANNITTDYAGLIDKFENNSTGIEITFQGRTHLRADFGTGSSYVAAFHTKFVNDGAWHHVAATCNGTQGVFYVDGVPAPPVSLPSWAPANSQPMLIGKDSDNRHFRGRIDEVTVYSRALSEAEVQAAFLAGTAGKCTNQINPPFISPATTNLLPGQTVAFVAGEGTPPYTFTLVANPAGGSLTPEGVYTAGLGCGTNIVRVTDALNAIADARVTVPDITPPVITCPTNITQEAQSATGRNVNFTVPPATDNCTPSPTRVCTPTNGFRFPIGTTTVTCTATDAAGNSNSCTFTITVRDTVPPSISCPNRIAEATSPSGAVVNFTPTVTDAASVPVTVCTPPSGSGFPLGANSVTCTATDGAGNSNSCTFTVTVRDTTAPTLTCPTVVSVQTTNPAGMTVEFPLPTVTDAADPAPVVICAPPSGTFFPPGASNVTCIATDAAGNSRPCAFPVNVTIIPTAFVVSGQALESGGAPLASVRLTLSGPGVAAEMLTDAGGNYAFPAVGAGSYELTAVLQNFSFAQSPRTVMLDVQHSTQDFIGTRVALNISGRVTNIVTGGAMARARVLLTPGNLSTFTDAGGQYFFFGVPLANNLVVQAFVSGATLTPERHEFPSPASDLVADFGVLLHLQISGVVRGTNGLGIPGVTMTLSGSAADTTTTDLGGNYVFSEVPGGDLAVTPTSYSHTFTPADQSFTNLLKSAGANFTGVLQSNAPGKLALRYATSPIITGGTRVHDFGSGASVVLNIQNLPHYSHSWSPDGRHIYFSNGRGILRMNADGSGVTTIASLLTNAFPALSPDGARIAYVLPEGAGPLGGSASLYVMDTNGANRVRLVPNLALPAQPAWSPDSHQLVFSGSAGLYRVNADGTGQARFATNGVFAEPAWSPDGTVIAARGQHSTGSSIYFLNSSNGTATLRVQGVNPHSPCFSPDGTMLAFVRGVGAYARVQVTPVAGGGEQVVGSLGDGLSAASWGRQAFVPTPIGINVPAEIGAVSMTFGNVLTDGVTTIDRQPGRSPNPGRFVIGGLTYDIHTTAAFDGLITICFTMPDSMSQARFDTLAILHGETDPVSGVVSFVDRTVRSGPLAPDYATRRICAEVTSLSPFLITADIDPALPQITGLVADAQGRPLAGAQVALTGDAEDHAETDAQGEFSFVNLSTNGHYLASVEKAGYTFNPMSADIARLGAGTDLVFIATPVAPPPVPLLAITRDQDFGGQPVLTWPGHPLEFLLESAGDLHGTNWLPALELPVAGTNGVIVPLTPTEPAKFYRLRRP